MFSSSHVSFFSATSFAIAISEFEYALRFVS